MKSTEQALQDYQNGLIDWAGTEIALPPSLSQDLIQIPMVGSAIVITYNIPGLNTGDPPMVRRNFHIYDVFYLTLSLAFYT